MPAACPVREPARSGAADALRSARLEVGLDDVSPVPGGADDKQLQRWLNEGGALRARD